MNINEGDDLSSHPVPILNSTASLIGKDINVSITSHVTQQNQSQIALACDAVENKRVELVPNMSAFIVQGNNKKTYSVQLFPKEKCNCPSTTTCWHIITSELSLGIHNIIPGKININLSQLKRNSRTRVDKKSGRKQPRPNDMDTEIILAPDSQETTLAMSNNHSQGKKPKLENIAKHSDLLDMYE